VSATARVARTTLTRPAPPAFLGMPRRPAGILAGLPGNPRWPSHRCRGSRGQVARPGHEIRRTSPRALRLADPGLGTRLTAFVLPATAGLPDPASWEWVPILARRGRQRPPGPPRNLPAPRSRRHRPARPERRHQPDLLRDSVGNRFRPVLVELPWSERNGGGAAQITRTLHDEPRCGDLPVLADAREGEQLPQRSKPRSLPPDGQFPRPLPWAHPDLDRVAAPRTGVLAA